MYVFLLKWILSQLDDMILIPGYILQGYTASHLVKDESLFFYLGWVTYSWILLSWVKMMSPYTVKCSSSSLSLLFSNQQDVYWVRWLIVDVILPSIPMVPVLKYHHICVIWVYRWYIGMCVTWICWMRAGVLDRWDEWVSEEVLSPAGSSYLQKQVPVGRLLERSRYAYMCYAQACVCEKGDFPGWKGEHYPRSVSRKGLFD
jgi:hypothetical protein